MAIRWINHNGKMVATNLPEGTTPANWNEKNPMTQGSCDMSLSGMRGAGVVTKTYPLYAKIKKTIMGGGRVYCELYGDSSLNLGGIIGLNVHKEKGVGKVKYFTTGNNEEKAQAALQHFTSLPNKLFTNGGRMLNNGWGASCPNYQMQFILSGHSWIDTTGGIKVNGQTYEEYHAQLNKQQSEGDFRRRLQREKDENKRPSETDVAYHTRMKKMWEQTGGAEAERYVKYHTHKIKEYTDTEKREDENMNRMSNHPDLMSFAEQSYMRW